MAKREKKGKRQEWDKFRGTRVLKVRRGRANAGITDARVSVARITDTGFTNAGIADAGFALQEW